MVGGSSVLLLIVNVVISESEARLVTLIFHETSSERDLTRQEGDGTVLIPLTFDAVISRLYCCVALTVRRKHIMTRRRNSAAVTAIRGHHI